MPEFPPEFLAGLPLVCSLASLTLGLAVAALLGYLWHERQNRSAIEQELKENESRYRAIFETAVDAIIVSDQHGTIREFSKAVERMTGYSAAEVIGRNMRVLLPPQLREEHERYTARYLWSARELEVCRKDGSIFPAQLSIAEWWAGGHRHFTGGMAHDFNNMLGVIIGNIDLLRDLKNDDPDVEELTCEALDAAFRGADLTRRLLAFARQQPLQPQCVDVNVLVSGITRLLSRTLGEDIEISLHLSPE